MKLKAFIIYFIIANGYIFHVALSYWCRKSIQLQAFMVVQNILARLWTRVAIWMAGRLLLSDA
ncbi:hypothetical protein ODX41_08520, partial [Salmonella enterica subsp. enterica serovar Enteritidis]|uniref:hypothetical protein n=1 Tax=Salmonella enterica TaxID=28901 RepID=UPI0032E3A121